MPGAMLHVGMQTKDAHGVLHGIPSPVDGDPTIPWPVDYWLPYVQDFLRFGGTVVALPPITGGASLGTGYDPYNLNDWGSNPHNPRGRRETRYGSAEQMAAFFAEVAAMGGQCYTNVVHHHLDGDRGDWRYDYVGADGVTPGRGRFDENSFWVPGKQGAYNPDRVFNKYTDWGFGREFRWETGTYGDGQGENGPGYVRRTLAESLEAQTKRFGVSGYFLDDAKGTAVAYLGWLLSQSFMRGQYPFVELSDGQTATQEYWLGLTSHKAGVLDFPLRYRIRDVCNHGADMRGILSEGVCWRSPAQAVTFTTNIDLDLSDPIISRALLGNSLILGFPGYPMIFGRDLYDKPIGYGLGDKILNLLWCYSTFVKGDLFWRATAVDHLVWEMMGDHTSSGVLCAASIRNDWTKVTVPTKWKASRLHDYCGHADDVWTDAQGNATIWLPPDGDGQAGRGYVRYAVPDVDNPIRLPARQARQVIVGRADMDTLPAKNGSQTVTWISCADGSPIYVDFTPSAPVPDGGSIVVRALGPDGKQLGSSTNGRTLDVTAYSSGRHTIQVSGNGLPDGGVPFAMTLTYSA